MWVRDGWGRGILKLELGYKSCEGGASGNRMQREGQEQPKLEAYRIGTLAAQPRSRLYSAHKTKEASGD